MFKHKTFRDHIDNYDVIQESARDKLVDFLNTSSNIKVISITENADTSRYDGIKLTSVTLYYKEVDVE